MADPIFANNPNYLTAGGMDWATYFARLDAISAGLAHGNLRAPLLFMPLRNSVVPVIGKGTVTFDRASVGTYIDYSDGLLKTAAVDEPRFEAAGCLVEGARTNLLLYSNVLDNAYWVVGNTTVTANATAGPDGLTTADKLVETATTNFHTITSGTVSFTAGVRTARSAWVKAAERTKVSISVRDAAGTVVYANVDVDLSTGAIIAGPTFGGGCSAVTGNPTRVIAGPNGWYRVELPVTMDGAVSTAKARVALLDAAGSNNYAGDGTSGLYVAWQQFEVGDFATSAIDTTSATVTRSGDNPDISIEGNIGLQDKPGTIFADFDILGNAQTVNQHIVRVPNETTRMLAVNSTGSLIGQWGSASALTGDVVSPLTVYRAGIRHAGSGAIALWMNGVLKASATGSVVTDPLGPSIDIGHSATLTPLFGHVSNLVIFAGALTDREMALV